MDIALAQTIISAAVGAILALITTFLAQRLSKQQNLEQENDNGLKELQDLYIDVKMQIDEEIRSWWINMEYGDEKGPKPSTYVYPIDKLRMLTERYEPSLNKDIEQVVGIIQILRGNDDPEEWMPPEAYYRQYIERIVFSKTKENLATKFKEINHGYYQKRNSKAMSYRILCRDVQ